MFFSEPLAKYWIVPSGDVIRPANITRVALPATVKTRVSIRLISSARTRDLGGKRAQSFHATRTHLHYLSGTERLDLMVKSRPHPPQPGSVDSTGAKPRTDIEPNQAGAALRIRKAVDARSARILLVLPRPCRPILWAVKVVSLRDLHHAQTFRFPLVADKSAASALHSAL